MSDDPRCVVTFVGAGPGAADLLTLRGARAIAEADVVVWARSLVAEEVLEHAREGAEIVESASLTLEEIGEVYERARERGHRVARAHSGDPTLYSAVGEQIRLLEGLGIPYEIVPGVSSIAGAAAALGRELTVPERAQSLIVSRREGRSPMPAGERLTALASHGTTMALLLSIGKPQELQAELLDGGYAPETPCAVVHRASWPDELVIRCPLRELAERVAEAGIERQAIVLVGPGLADDPDTRSHLYDPAHGHRFPPGRGRAELMPLTLVIGGTRSGKSEFAERAVAEAGLPVSYVATGTPSDDEMAARIARHRERRPADWRTVETTDPLESLEGTEGRALMLDSLGGWVAALLDRDRDDALERVRVFAERVAERPEPTVVVAEETGLGPVPANELARRFCDLAGEAAQVVSAAASRCVLVVAGRALELAMPEPAIDSGLRFHADALAREAADDHAVSVVDAPRPGWLEDALAEGVRASTAYPDERAAREVIAARHDRPPEEVVLTNGANESFWLLAAALRPRRAVCVHPSYTEPEAALRAHGVAVERAFRDPERLALDPAAVPGGADLVVTGNPNNPSGTLDPAERVASLARPGRSLVVDEAFMDFVPGEAESLAARRDLPGVVVVRSLTKLWSLPGIRAGYLLAPRRIAAAIERVRPSWSVNSVALSALRACARRVGEAEARARQVAAARGALAAGLDRARGVETWPSAANFVLARDGDGGGLAERLLARGIAVRPCQSFPGLGPEHFRVAVRDDAANQRLVTAVAETAG